MTRFLSGACKRALNHAARLALAVTVGVVAHGAIAGPLVTPQNPVERAAVHDFDDEHAHLAQENEFDRIHPLVLAALPKGKAYVKYNAPSNCVPGKLKAVIARVSAKYGPVTVNSTYRSKGKNRRVGGKGKSYHLSCAAVDFRVHGSTRGMIAFLSAQREVGGLKRYKSGFYHIDTGPRRSW